MVTRKFVCLSLLCITLVKVSNASIAYGGYGDDYPPDPGYPQEFLDSVLPPSWQAWIPKRVFRFAQIGKRRSLGHYNVDRRFTVSGLSGGASFSMILSFVMSDLLKGAGIFVGAPMGSFLALANDARNFLDFRAISEQIDRMERRGLIPPTSNLKSWTGVYVHHGITDPIPKMLDKINVELFKYYGVPKVKPVLSKYWGTHCIPTAGYLGEKQGSCPLIMQLWCACGYCGVCDMFSTVLSNYRPANLTALPTGTLYRFPQSEFVRGFDSHGSSFSDFGWAYIPKRCEPDTGIKCHLHFHFHGCGEQISGILGGWVPQWMLAYHLQENADANDIVLVTPQALFNLQNLTIGCYDLFSHTGFFRDAFSTRYGVHPTIIRRMYERVTFGK